MVLVGGPPADVPGWNALDARRAEFREALRSFGLEPGGRAPRRITVGKGSVLVGDDVEVLLAQAGVAREPMADAGVRFVRRVHPRGADYFLVNRGAAPVDGWVKLGTGGPLGRPPRPAVARATGGVAALRRGAASEVYLQLEPGESAVLRTFASESGPGQSLAVRRGRRRPGAGGRPVAPRVRRGRPRPPRVLRAARARVVDDARGRRRPSASPAPAATPCASSARPATPSTGSSTWGASPRRRG